MGVLAAMTAPRCLAFICRFCGNSSVLVEGGERVCLLCSRDQEPPHPLPYVEKGGIGHHNARRTT